MNTITYCKENYEYSEIQNAVRFNKIVDVYNRKKDGKISVFIIPEQKWYYPKNEEELSDIVVNHLEFYDNRPALANTRKDPHPHRHLSNSTYRHKKPKRMKDTDLMPWGKHQGEKMANLPPDYLIWLFENNKCGGEVLAYIRANESNLRMEIKNSKKEIR